VAYVTGSAAAGYQTFVINGIAAELVGFGTNRCVAQPNASRTLNGSVAGVGAADPVYIGFGNASGNANGGAPNFQLQQAPNFAADLIASWSLITVGAGGGINPTKLIFRRGVEYPNNGAIPVLNFATDGFAPVSAQLTINNLNNDNAGILMNYVTPTTTAFLGQSLSSQNTTHTLKGVPAGQQMPSDLHQLLINTVAGPGSTRVLFTWFRTLQNMAVTMGPELTLPTVTPLGTAPYPRYQSSGPIQAEYDDVFLMTLNQGSGTTGRLWAVTSTKAYIGAGGNYTLIMPDLTAAGYQALWGPAVGVQASFSTAAYGNSGNGYLLPVFEGGLQQFGIRSTAVTP